MRWLSLLALLASCCRQEMIRVHREYLDTRYLASSYVESPDARRCWFYGEQLIVNWRLPREWMCRPDLHLFVTLRFGSEEVESFKIPVRECKGASLYRLVGEAYCEKGGIVTYKIDLYSERTLLHAWKHQVWAELIEFQE